MNCGKIRDLLSAYIDNQLRPRERGVVESHLRSCPACAEELSLLRQTIALAGSLPEVELPRGFHASLSARLAAVAAEQQAGSAHAARHAAAYGSSVAGGDGARAITVLGRMGRAMRRPAWRNALAMAATLVLVFAVTQYAFPGWDGNVWSLGARQYRLAGAPESTEGGRSVSLPAPGGTTSKAPGSGESVAAPSGTDAGKGGQALVDSTLTAPPPAAGQDGSMIIRTANLTVEVRDFAVADREIVPLVDGVGGYIESSSASLSGKVRSGWYRIRVPQGKFVETITKLEGLGALKGKELGSEDVSGAIIDLEARISNLRRQELRLGQLLGQAKTLDEILRVENELNRVRYQIEAAEGQLKWYRNRVTMSTIHLNLAEPGEPTTPPVPGADLWRRMWAAFVATWHGIGGFLVGLAVFVASISPVALLLAALWWAVRRYRSQGGWSRRAKG
jgi:hypothetical protein